MTPPKRLQIDPIAEALQLLGLFNRAECRLSEAQAERAIRDLVERYRRCKEELATRPTPAQMRKARGELLKLARSWDNAKNFPAGRDALRDVLHEMDFHLELVLVGSTQPADATAAQQPALGIAGTPSADVITVQGSPTGMPQPVSVGNFPATQPASATAQPLPAAAATTAKQRKIGTDEPVETFELLLDEFSRVASELAAAAQEWRGKGWKGKVAARLVLDPDLLLLRDSYALLGACGKPPKMSRKGSWVKLARVIWKVANPSLRRSAPRFRKQIDRLNRSRYQGARKRPGELAQARLNLQNWLQPGVDRLIWLYAKS